MSNFLKIADVSTERKTKKLQRALEATGSGMNYNAMVAEMNMPGAQDYPKYRLMVTPNYICSYANRRSILVISMNEVVNVYRTNMPNGNYDFYHKYIAVEWQGTAAYMAKATLKINPDEHEAIIQSLKSRVAMNGGR